MDTEQRTLAQAMITGFVAGVMSTHEAATSLDHYDAYIRRLFWVWAPQRLELESAYVGELGAWLEQAMGEAGLPDEGEHGRPDFGRIERE